MTFYKTALRISKRGVKKVAKFPMNGKSLLQDYEDILLAEQDVINENYEEDILEESKLNNIIDFSIFDQQIENFLFSIDKEDKKNNNHNPFFMQVERFGSSVAERNILRYVIDVDRIMNQLNKQLDSVIYDYLDYLD